MRKPFEHALKLCLFVVFAVFIAACQSTPAPTPTLTFTPTPPPSPTLEPTVGRLPNVSIADPTTRASLRFVSVASGENLPDIDLYLESGLAGNRLRFGSTTRPLPVDPGTYNLRAVPAGEPASSGSALFSQPVELGVRSAAIGLITGNAESLTLIPIFEDISAISNTASRIRFVFGGGDPVTVNLDSREIGAFSEPGQASDPIGIAPGSFTVTVSREGEEVLTQRIAPRAFQSYTYIVATDSAGETTLIEMASPVLQEGRVRVINASPTAGEVDVYLGRTRVAQALGYAESGEWQVLLAQGYDLRVVPPDAPVDDPAIFAGRVTLDSGNTVNLVIYDNAEARALPGQVVTQAGFFAESLAPTVPNESRITFLNLARSAVPVEVLAPSAPITDRLDYAVVSTATTVTASEVSLVFADAAGNDAHRNYVGTLEAGKSYFYVITGELSDILPPLLYTTDIGVDDTLLYTPTPQPQEQMQVRIINAFMEPITMRLDGERDFNLESGEITETFTLDSGTHYLSIFPGIDQNDESLYTEQLRFEPGATITVVALGTAEQASWFQLEDARFDQSGESTIRFVNAVPNVPSVSVYLENAARERSELVNGLPYGNVSRSVSVPGGTYRIEVLNGADGLPLVSFEAQPIDPDALYTLLALPERLLLIKMP
jgi:hypothetical protein